MRVLRAYRIKCIWVETEHLQNRRRDLGSVNWLRDISAAPAIIIVSVDYKHCHMDVVFEETTVLGDFRLAAAVDRPWDRLDNNVWSAVVLQRVTPAIGQRIARENRPRYS